MSDLIRREDVLKALWNESWQETYDIIRALPAVQPEDPRAVAMRDAIARYRASSAGQAIADLIDRPAAPHVNETPKSEHEARDVLKPATKGVE